MAGNYSRQLFNDYQAACEANDALKTTCKNLSHDLTYEKAEHLLTQRRLQKLEEKHKELEEKHKKLQDQYDDADKERLTLREEVDRLKALLNTDGTNSGTSTSKTPIHKKKINPNSREKTGNHVGGKDGHPKNSLPAIEDDKITETVDHVPETCPECGDEDLVPTGKVVIKDEIDYEFVPRFKRHQFIECRCTKCGKTALVPIPNNLKEANQYGPNVQALILTEMNTGNVPINKVKRIVAGLSEGEINPSEGYISKVQKRAALQLAPFVEELKEHCKQLSVLHWDDTVIDINTNRGCLRFYGDENAALFTAHSKKNKEGIDEDGILSALPSTTKVVHDHCLVNYNKDYGFTNAECCVHLLRDLERIHQESSHEWAQEMKHLFSETNKERNEEIDKGSEAFTEERTQQFFDEFNRILADAFEQQRADENRYYCKEEKALINRLVKYKDNYCMFVVDFEVPFSNNLALCELLFYANFFNSSPVYRMYSDRKFA